jgi:membrane protein YqaA with SNARE-associated domain
MVPDAALVLPDVGQAAVLTVGSGCEVANPDAITTAVCTATGPTGLVLVAAYSFLIAIVLPLPSEIVLAAPLNLGTPTWATLAVIMLVSGLAKAGGSLVAFHVGQEAKSYGPLVRRIKNSRFDVIEWSERRTVQIAQRWGYVGLALALSVPFFPDTLSIYAFTVLEENYLKFGLATFVGSIGRLLVTLGIVGGGLALV